MCTSMIVGKRVNRKKEEKQHMRPRQILRVLGRTREVQRVWSAALAVNHAEAPGENRCWQFGELSKTTHGLAASARVPAQIL